MSNVLSRTNIPSERSWPGVRTTLWLEAWSSGCNGEAMGCPTALWNPSSYVTQINTSFMQLVRKHKVQLKVSDLEALAGAIEAWGD